MKRSMNGSKQVYVVFSQNNLYAQVYQRCIHSLLQTYLSFNLRNNYIFLTIKSLVYITNYQLGYYLVKNKLIIHTCSLATKMVKSKIHT